MKTAVGYIENCIEKYLAYSIEGNHKAEPFTITDLLEAVEQAKAMERNEHAQTWDAALSHYKERGEVFIRAWEDFDDYYNEITKELE